MINKGAKVKIIWNDASLVSPKRKEIALSPMETVGFVERDDEQYMLIRDPKTINRSTKEKHPEKDPTFYFIPKGMIESIDVMG